MHKSSLLQIFSLIFIVEAIFKLVAMGPVTYARDPWNDFDFVIVFISVVELLIGLSAGGAGGTGLNVLRTLRLVNLICENLCFFINSFCLTQVLTFFSFSCSLNVNRL